MLVGYMVGAGGAPGLDSSAAQQTMGQAAEITVNGQY